ncbi:3'(2'),5'-bisphosphate nucleotidase CysQ [Vibrio stylophorae]|uniref:3'(2'),5'-bisphosphate nucleotidase CysQ n=1 Tax=Vibrio stylophorae TaxID=659351 RepID=A0ABM8ZRA4_9VIBR|nr:3'(2'),5'-bisphosphate nucleotidase CysQ [Vibrio stylophorae]CAH0532441.1 3'(2'),5'-bisphosphate nucleotidase CysQ [Vibrio stylophorae]
MTEFAPSHLLIEILTLAQSAGDAAMQHYHGAVSVAQKADDSPVTAADLAANAVIVAGLSILTPDTPILSEETQHAPWSERQSWQQFWLVDPLDGTKEFIKQNGEFTVNIALIDQGKPVLSVVYAPALGMAWGGDQRESAQAWRIEQGLWTPIQSQWQHPPVVVGSRSHPSPELAEYLKSLGEHQLVDAGSSLKFCWVAEGRVQLYPRLAPTMMWDTAAGQCVAECAGALVVNLQGEPLNYHREALLNPHFVVRAPRETIYEAVD